MQKRGARQTLNQSRPNQTVGKHCKVNKTTRTKWKGGFVLCKKKDDRYKDVLGIEHRLYHQKAQSILIERETWRIAQRQPWRRSGF
jgi:hypothetical protein